jgi:hypothetical protein
MVDECMRILSVPTYISEEYYPSFEKRNTNSRKEDIFRFCVGDIVFLSQKRKLYIFADYTPHNC